MITRITFGPLPPPGKYSPGNRGILSASPEHPAAPTRPTPAAPTPAALKKSLRVSALPVLSFTPEKSLRRSQKANCNRKARYGSACACRHTTACGLRLSAHYGLRPPFGGPHLAY